MKASDDELLAAYLDGVAELTPEERHRVEAKLATRRAVLTRGIGQQIIGDEANVVFTLTKRRKLDPKHGQLREQILTEQSCRDVILESRFARRDHAAMYRRLVPDAEARNAVLLQRAEQAILQRHRQIADFVEKHRTAASQLQHAKLAVRVSTRRGDAEQLHLEQRRRNRGAVDGNERRVRVVARVMDAASDELFARACFSRQQQRPQRSGGNATRHVQRVPHACTLGNDGGKLVGAFARGGIRSL